jgi:integrase
MTPRKASLRVAHQRDCANASKTALSSVGRGNGCACSPSYYAFRRLRDGSVEKGERVKTRSIAQEQVNEWQVEIDRGRAGVSRPKNPPFSEWADEFEGITQKRVDDGDLKPRTLTAYRESLVHARAAFGDVPLRELGPPELRTFYDRLGGKPASRLRHLRQLSACLSAAVDEGYLTINPLTSFTKKLKLRAPKRGKAPFEDDELERLWKAFGDYEPVYLAAARFSVETGARAGELIALDWPNVDLTSGRVLIEHTFDPESGLVAPKDREPRMLYLTPQARAVLEEWVGIVGARDEGPVFPNPIGGGRLQARMLGRRLESGMADAGIPKQHTDLRLPRSWHSFRYTTSNVLQRRGLHPRYIEALLGHGTLELTYGVYGAWSGEQLAAEAARTPGDE